MTLLRWIMRSMVLLSFDVVYLLTFDLWRRTLLRHLKTISKDTFPFTRATTSIHQTPLSDISLRVNQPYWLLHHGNCEHFVVVDQIRYRHAILAQLTVWTYIKAPTCIWCPIWLSINTSSHTSPSWLMSCMLKGSRCPVGCWGCQTWRKSLHDV